MILIFRNTETNHYELIIPKQHQMRFSLTNFNPNDITNSSIFVPNIHSSISTATKNNNNFSTNTNLLTSTNSTHNNILNKSNPFEIRDEIEISPNLLNLSYTINSTSVLASGTSLISNQNQNTSEPFVQKSLCFPAFHDRTKKFNEKSKFTM